MPQGTIFISYRRGPDENAAGRLYEALEDKIGGDRIFMDVDGLRPGADFVADLDQKLGDCAAFLAVIGPNWIERQRELHDEGDFVRREYEAVLNRTDIPFIPIFFHDAQMPHADELPPSLAGLVRRNGFTMPHEHFTSVLQGRLLPELSAILGEDLTETAPKSGMSGTAKIIAGVAAALVLGTAGLTAISGGTGWVQRALSIFEPNQVGRTLFETGNELSNFSRIAFSPDGATIASGDANLAVKLWDIASGDMITQLRGHTDRIEMVTFSHDGQYLASVGKDNLVRIWELGSGTEVATLSGHEDWVFSADFSSDDQLLVTASADDTAKIWDWQSGRMLTELSGHRDNVEMAMFSPDDQRIVTASIDSTMRIWDAATGDLQTEIAEHDGPVMAVAFLPDGSGFGTASEDMMASLWDVFSGNELARFDGHEDAVTGIAISNDGNLVVTSSTDGTSRVWDAFTEEEIGRFAIDEAEFLTIALSEDGTKMATATYTELIVTGLDAPE